MEADGHCQVAIKLCPRGQAAQLDHVVGMLVRAGIQRGQEDVAGFFFQLKMSRQVQEVAGKFGGIDGQEMDLLETNPKISAKHHHLDHPTEDVVLVAE